MIQTSFEKEKTFAQRSRSFNVGGFTNLYKGEKKGDCSKWQEEKRIRIDWSF